MAKKDDYAHFEKFANDVEGYEGLNNSTMAIPFIRVLQSLSPQLKKSKPEYIPEAEEGQICNSVSGRIYEAPLRVVIGKFERLFIEWKPNRGGFVQAHSPETCENNPEYVLNEKYQLVAANGNILVDTYMYYVLLADFPGEGICVISMSSTQLKEAKKLNRMLMTTFLPGTAKKALPHFMTWTMDTVEMSNDGGDWYNPRFNFEGFVTQDLLEAVVSERKSLPSKTVDYALLNETAGKDAQGREPVEGKTQF